jgi:hypothetical protein
VPVVAAARPHAESGREEGDPIVTAAETGWRRGALPATRALAIVSLAAATLGAGGCRSCGDAGQFLGAVLGTAAVVMLESHSEDDCHHEYEYEHCCGSRR